MVYTLGEKRTHCKKVQKIFSKLQQHSNKHNPVTNSNLKFRENLKQTIVFTHIHLHLHLLLGNIPAELFVLTRLCCFGRFLLKSEPLWISVLKGKEIAFREVD